MIASIQSQIKFVEEFPNEMIRNSISFNFLTNLYATTFFSKEKCSTKTEQRAVLAGTWQAFGLENKMKRLHKFW
jgi:hypothetical protein